MGTKRSARVIAETVAVLCPHCDEPQPSPDNGSDAWLPAQVKAGEGMKTCVSCDKPFCLLAQSRVPVPQ